MDCVEQLEAVGFSQYEAQAYVALLRDNPLNGYELAKASGIPRPNIYTVLKKLEEAGAVMRFSVPDGTRYAPIPADELLAKLKRHYQQSVDAAAASLQQITSPPDLEPVLNLRGYEALLDQARALVDQSQDHLLLSIWPAEALALAEPVRQAQERGVEITTLCLRNCPNPCPACQGNVFRYALAPAAGTRWLVLVADERELLAGEIHEAGTSAAGNCTAVRTRQPMLVNLSASYVQNSIALARILTHFGKRLFTELDPQSVTVLNQLHPLHTQGAWLEVMQQILNEETTNR